MKQLTEIQQYRLAGAGMGNPKRLSEVGKEQIAKPFIYDREYGFFQVGPGYLYQAAALLYSFHTGSSAYYDAIGIGKFFDAPDGLDQLLSEFDGIAVKGSSMFVINSDLNEEESKMFINSELRRIKCQSEIASKPALASTSSSMANTSSRISSRSATLS